MCAMMFSNYYHVLTRLSCLDKYYDRDDPSLPLLDALREGGFIFPAIDDSNTPQVSKLCVLIYCLLYLGMNSNQISTLVLTQFIYAMSQYAVVDSDNVKITQRKNQLLRRIRTAKKKAGII